MSIRVVARIRPLLEKEAGKDSDVIVSAASNDDGLVPNMVKIPNPKNESEEFSFAFNSVYDQPTTQEQLFNAEGMHRLRHVFPPQDHANLVSLLQSPPMSRLSSKASMSPSLLTA